MIAGPVFLVLSDRLLNLIGITLSLPNRYATCLRACLEKNS